MSLALTRALRALVIAGALLVVAFTGTALATSYTVTNPADTTPGTACPTNDTCSLRQAVESATTTGDTITIAPNTYKLDNGDLSVSADITITGASATNTIIDAQQKSRIFDTTGHTVTIADVAMINGLAPFLAQASGFESLNSGDGGAILNDVPEDALTLDHVALRNNSAPNNGGAIGGAGDVTIRDSELSGNKAGVGKDFGTYRGGAVDQGSADISNTTLSNNNVSGSSCPYPPRGSAVYVDGQLTSVNNTIAGNTVTANRCIAAGPVVLNLPGGGAIAGGLKTSAILRNTILTSNTITSAGGTQGSNCDMDEDITSQGDNVVDENDTCKLTGAGDIVGDSKLGPLQSNGGQTQTQAIGQDSAAFDHAANNGCPNHDQRDLPRPQFAGCDSGAFELQPPPPPPPPAPVQVAAQQVTAAGPTLRIAGARAGCARASTRLRVRLTAAGGVRSVKVTLGSKVIKRTKSTSFTVTVKRSALRIGHNVVKIVVTDAQGRHATRRAALTRCRVRVAPRFTG